jgi:regulator of replication initiation timing
MHENQDNQMRIDPKDLFATIGEMSVELRMVRTKLNELQQENGKLREHNKELIKQANTTPAAKKGD